MLPKEREDKTTLIKYNDNLGTPKSRHETVTGQFKIIIIKNPLLSDVLFHAICEDKIVVTNAADQVEVEENDEFKSHAREHGMKLITTVKKSSTSMYQKLMSIPRGAVHGKTSSVAKNAIERENPTSNWNSKRNLPLLLLE